MSLCSNTHLSPTRHGTRNSLLLAPMPTASTAQILGNNESIEPYTSNIYSRRVLSGEFQVVNHHLLRDLTDLGLWDEAMKHKLIAHNGSVQVHLRYLGMLQHHLISSVLEWYCYWMVTAREFMHASYRYNCMHAESSYSK